MGIVNLFGNIKRWLDQYYLEASCHSALNIWQDEHPEYIDKIKRWIESDSIPEDNDLQTVCRVYKERLKPRPPYHGWKFLLSE